MTFDQLLAVAGLVVGLLGIALAYYFYVKTIKTKQLVIGISDPVPMTSREGPGFSYKVFFLLWNRGTAPIEQSDFIAPIKIRPKDRIAEPDLISKDVAASVEFAENDTIQLKLLRPSEAVIFSVYFLDQTRPELDV